MLAFSTRSATRACISGLSFASSSL
ncbi:DUF3649 domain-containing protein [Escherichia coli]|nr:DUF3649 domain-containing protein [Escherichia coli]EKS4937937.1 DUF3649 domain-containing protein [Escherichia coli]